MTGGLISQGTNEVMEVDELDRKILHLLQLNGQIGYRELAAKAGTNPSTVFNRVKSLEKRGVIKGYTAILSPSALGYDLTAIIFVRITGPHLIELEQKIASLPAVQMVYDITGDYDVMVIAKFRNMNELNSFVKGVLSMQYVERTLTNLALNVVKEEPLLPL